MVDEYRHELDVKDVYKSRSHHVERVFADAKIKHGLSKTQFRGKRRVSSEIGLVFASMNLKKYAKYIKDTSEITSNLQDFVYNLLKYIKKRQIDLI